VTTSDQPLALVRFDAGSTNVGQIIDLRVWAGQGGGLVAMHNAVRQYLDAPGSQFYVGPVLHVRRMNANGTASWVEVDLASGEIAQDRLSAAPVAASNFGSSASGWSTNSGVSSRLLRWGRWRQLDLYSRKAGGSALTANSLGNFPDTVLFTLNSEHRPSVNQVVACQYRPNNGTTTTAITGTALVNTNGRVYIAAGIPNTSIVNRTLANNWSVRVSATWLV